MATRGMLPSLKFLVKRNQLIGQLRSSHVMQLTQYSIDNSSNNTVKSKYGTKLSAGLLLNPYNLNCSITRRWKHGKKKSKSEAYDSDDEEEENEDSYAETTVAHSRSSKIINTTMSSMRIDAIVKTALNMARNKAEIALYNGKLRVNGKKPMKKGVQVRIDDVIDLVHGPSPNNDKFLLVSRITILDASLEDRNYKVKMLREKSLLIEQYDDSYQPVSSES